jgi:hypothetical protein
MVRRVRESPGRAVNRLAGCGVDRVYAGGHLGEQKSVVVGEEPGNASSRAHASAMAMIRPLVGMADHLRCLGVTRVVMEATSGYWRTGRVATRPGRPYERPRLVRQRLLADRQ